MKLSAPFLRSISISIVLLLTACGGSGSKSDTSSNTVSKPAASSSSQAYVAKKQLAPDVEPDPHLPVSSSDDWVNAVDAARFLAQASFGVTAKDIDFILKTNKETWFENQLNQAQSIQLELLDERLKVFGYAPDGNYLDPDLWYRRLMRSDIWWETAVWGKDQLRQRVAFALSQILVVSQQGNNTYSRERGFAHYHDLLARHALGNYEDLLLEISTNPVMGVYLSSINNPKANPELSIRPDENYARELLQLFSIGLDELNLDGTPKLDEKGNKIPTYDQNKVKEFARVFTGWSLAGSNTFAEFGIWGDQPTNVLPLKPFADAHDSAEKVLLNGEIIPAGNTPENDLRAAVRNIIQHDNIGPFISKKLIQYLITSNPSPAYVARVASAFNDNGAGVKGDMKAVVRAIYFDEEARNPPVQDQHFFGKAREFPLMVSGLWRAFKAQGVEVKNARNTRVYTFRYVNNSLNEEQSAFNAPSVFNYYQSYFSPPGLLSQNQLLAPEFQLLNQGSSISQANLLACMIFNRHKDDPDLFSADLSAGIDQRWGVGLIWADPPLKARLNLTTEIELAQNPGALVDRLNLLLTQGQINTGDTQRIAQHISLLNDPLDRIYEAIFLMAISPEYAVQQ